MKRSVIILLLCVFIVSGLGAAVVEPRLDEGALVAVAEEQGYGYKYGNLDALKRLLEFFNSTVNETTMFKVQVPDFVGISNGQVIAALGKVGFDVAKKWTAVVKTLTKDKQDEALRNKKIPETFWNAQKSFIKELEGAFGLFNEENPFDLDEVTLGKLTDLFTQSKNDKLMVRSTGKEDTRKMANAGGNESIPNVNPSMTAVLQAAKVVVASYFGKKSLNQRLGLGDQTLFSLDEQTNTFEVFCPVLIQRMIGEKQGGRIPRCGVMFTEEVEGGIGYKEEKEELDDPTSRVKTTGITMIQAAYGHNEGVVNSRVVVDTYVAQNIEGQPVFYPVIRNKRERLVPSTGEGALKMTSNNSKMALAPALNEKALVTLKKFADALEQYYGYPMDVEFVVRYSIVWIVQARPLVHKKELKKRQPSYFADLKNIREDILLKGRTIVGFGGAITEVDLPKQAVIARRIGDALNTYLYKSVREDVVSVFSGTDAPATSHEATTFRSEGKPVLYVPEIGTLEGVFNDGKKLVFSPQQHCVAIVDAGQQLAVKEGWCAYPLPRELSVDPLLFAGENVKGFPKPAAYSDNVDLKELLADMVQEDVELAYEAATIFPDVLFALAPHGIARVTIDKDLSAYIVLLVRAAQVLCRRIIALCNSNASLRERLLPVNYLEALVYQQTFAEKGLHYLSVEMLRNTLKGEKVLGASGDVYSEVEALQTQLKKASSLCFSQATKNAWNKLLAGLQDLESLQTLNKLFAALNAFDIAPLWFNATMVSDVENTLDSSAYADLVRRWDHSYEVSKKSFDVIESLREDVKGFNDNRFAEENNFESAWGDLLVLYNEFTNEAFTNIVKNVTEEKEKRLAAFAACGLMTTFVDKFDKSIKAMKGCAQGKIEDKVTTFQVMLKVYYQLLEKWSELLTDETRPLLQAAMSIIENYLEMMKDLVGKKFDISDLEPSGGFDASPFAMGSGHDWVQDKQKNKQPATGEDGYTIIHQSLLNLCSVLAVSFGLETVKQPGVFVELAKILDDALSIGFRVQKKKLIGLSFDTTGMVLLYNVPLGAHSMQITFRQILKTGTVKIDINFFGGVSEEVHRWVNAAALMVIYALSYDFDVDIKKFHMHALNVVFEMKADKIQEILPNFFRQLVSIIKTFSGNWIDYSSLLTASYTSNFDEKKAVHYLKILEGYGTLGLWAETLVSTFLVQKHGVKMTEPVGAVAATAVQSGNFNVRDLGLSLYGALFKKGKGFVSATGAAAKAVLSGDANVQNFGFDLYKTLWGKNKGFVSAAEVAAIAVQSGDAYVQSTGLNLYRALVEKGKEFDSATRAAKTAVLSSYSVVQESGLALYRVLVEKYQGFDSAEEVAAIAVQSDNAKVRYFGLDLYMALFAKGTGFVSAERVAAIAVQSDNANVQRTGFDLYKTLVKKDQGFSSAAGTAGIAVQSNDRNVQAYGLNLYEALDAAGQGAVAYESLKDIPEEIYSKNSKLKELFESLKAQYAGKKKENLEKGEWL